MSPNPKIGEVYMVEFGGTGSEQSGMRPAVVFQNNVGNAHSPNVICLPMTSKLKKAGQPTHVVVPKSIGLKTDSMVLCENPECVSKSRLGNYITTIPQKYMSRIAEAHLLATSAIAYLDVDAIASLIERATKLNATA